MRKKRSSFLTFVFSLLPGAGHMYLGFMKMGISLMSAFFFLIFVATWLDISPLLFLLPVLWFFAFFDCLNRRSASDEEFALLDDNYLFSLDKLFSGGSSLLKKRNLFAGILLLCLGLYILWNNLLHNLGRYFEIPNELYWSIEGATRSLPQLLIGILIIFIGVRLIINKKREDEKNA